MITSSWKANQVLQDTTAQVLNQIQGAAIKNEKIVKELRTQNNYLVCQVATKNEEMSELQTVTKELQQLVTKLANPSELINRGGKKNQICF